MKIPKGVTDAIEAGITQVTRRLEIYQPNMTTLWSPNESDVQHRLVEGSVSINGANDERRTLDCTLDNTDNFLRPHPDKGLWYDKIIKVYRGVVYKTDPTPPTVLIMEAPDAATATAFQLVLRDIGYTRVFIDLGVSTIGELQDYDFIVSYMPTTKTAKASLLRRAYAQGMKIVTVGDDTTGTEFPQIGSTTAASGAWSIVPPSFDTPLAGGWSTETYSTDSGQRITSLGGTAQIVALGPSSSISAWTDYLPDVYTARRWMPGTIDDEPGTPGGYLISPGVQGIAVGEPDPTGPHGSVKEVPVREGGRWFHYQPYTFGSEAKSLLRNAMDWLWNKKPYSKFEAPLGIFMIDSFSEDNFPKTIRLTCRDLTKKALQSKIGVDISLKANAAIEEIIAVLANAGLTESKFPHHFDYEDVKGRLSWSAGTSRWEIAKALADRINLELFVDPNGVVIGRNYLDPSTSPIENTFKTGKGGNLVKYSKSLNDSRLFNHVVVRGTDDGGAGLPPWGEAINENPGSPTRVQRIGDRYTERESSIVKSDAQAAKMALRFLKKSALETYEISFDSLAYPWVEANEIDKVVMPDADDDDPVRFLVDSFTIPLAPGPMSGTAKRVTIVDDPSWAIRNHLPPPGGPET